ncbi:MAG: hypothetical protein PHV37_04195 [Candidatus Gastranaerophilales bacterium]|nr:hypothetical protein [Candidatus Gastranaerophilales bacterium]
MTNIMNQYLNVNSNAVGAKPVSNYEPPKANDAQPREVEPKNSNILEKYLNQAAINANVKVAAVDGKKTENVAWHNDLRSLFKNNEAVIMGIIPRTFNAKDKEGNQLIRGNDEQGTFVNAVGKLDEMKKLGINTLHVLPINPPGIENAMGTAGSLYAPQDFLKIDPALDDKNDPRSVEEELKGFIQEAHKRGIHVMLDLPSCASYDLFQQHPELMAFERNGLAKTPQGWNDIRMFNPWKDETKKELNPELVDLHKKFVDMCVDYGFDGIRSDVARTKPTEFWDIIIPYSRQKDPEFAWLAESYTYEDASPQLNMNYDRPEDCLRAGFDSYYGQYHIFHEWTKASELTNYVKENLQMSQGLEKGKSLIGSFGTHDDISLMFSGGPKFINLVSGLQATLPMTNPYYMDGYQSGDDYLYDFEGQTDTQTNTKNHECTVHKGRPDIFNFSRPLVGKHPEVGDFMEASLKMRADHKDVITHGSFIPLKVENDPNDQVIAFARHLNGKTLVVVANRNINERQKGSVNIPGLSGNKKLQNLLPTYGDNSEVQAQDGKINVDLGAARIHVFEVNTPDIEKSGLEVLKQNL